MPIYASKTQIQALGGNRIEWKIRFDVDGSGVLLVTAPPALVVRTVDAGGLPEQWTVQVNCPGEVVLEGYDLGFSERTTVAPAVAPFQGTIVGQWEQATRTMVLTRRSFNGAAAPEVLGRGETAWLTLWIRNTDVPITYSQEAS